MGKAIAQEAVRLGYRVEFVTGPVAEQNLPDLEDCGHIHKVVSAEEMLKEARRVFPASDVVIFAAAVADYAPSETLSEKMAKSSDELVLRLQPTPDIAQTLCAEKQDGQTSIGFALQTADGKANARRKLDAKNLDGIVLNAPSSLGAADGTFSFLAANGDSFEEWGRISKTDCAQRIFQQLEIIN
jgi:phosphopantothenoylcysteine decarboxylase/phosphopantothenate--cysteine ligase